MDPFTSTNDILFSVHVKQYSIAKILYLWKVSSSLKSSQEDSQLRAKEVILLSSCEAPFAFAPAAAFGAETFCSSFLCPKSQFGLLSCISLPDKQWDHYQQHLKLFTILHQRCKKPTYSQLMLTTHDYDTEKVLFHKCKYSFIKRYMRAEEVMYSMQNYLFQLIVSASFLP